MPGVVAVVLIALIAGGYFLFQSNQSSQTASTPTTMESPATNSSSQSSDPNQASAFKDGTYTATGNYTSPGGEEELGVTLTIKDGVVTESVVEPRATRPNSVRFQGIFSENYKPLVIGKNIDQLSLGKVSGSSLAPKGFNEAVEEIKAQARS